MGGVGTETSHAGCLGQKRRSWGRTNTVLGVRGGGGGRGGEGAEILPAWASLPYAPAQLR